jgi:hypothetical protein
VRRREREIGFNTLNRIAFGRNSFVTSHYIITLALKKKKKKSKREF